jgi:hypothetical protein
VLVAKAESAYAVAKERCDDKSGNDKDVCVKEAKAVEIKALVDAKIGKEIGEAKNSCVAAAKARFGKNWRPAIDRLPAPVPHRAGKQAGAPCPSGATTAAAADRGTPCVCL